MSDPRRRRSGRSAWIALICAVVAVCTAFVAVALRPSDDEPPPPPTTHAAERKSRSQQATAVSEGVDAPGADAPKPTGPTADVSKTAPPLPARRGADPVREGPIVVIDVGREAIDAGPPGLGDALARGGDARDAAVALLADSVRGRRGGRALRTRVEAPERGGLLVVARTLEDDRRVAGANVTITLPGADPAKVTADGAGAAFVPITGTTVTVRVSATGRVPVVIAGVAVGADELVRIDAVLERAIPAEGRVLLATGAGVGTARVRLFRREPWCAAFPFGEDPEPIETAGCDASGRFHLAAVPADTVSVIVVEAPKLAPAARVIEPVPDPAWLPSLVFELKKAHRFSGQVVLESGAPAAGAVVTVVPAYDPFAIEIDGGADRGTRIELLACHSVADACTDGAAAARLSRVRTAEDGTFSVLSDDASGCRAVALDPLRGRSAPADLSARGSGTLTLRGRAPADVTVERADRTPSVATLTSSLPWEPWSARTDAAGRTRIDDLDVGARMPRIDVAPPLVSWYYVASAAEARSMRFTLFDGAQISGTVTDAAGHPVRGADVSIDFARSTSDDAGAWRLDGVPPRNRQLRVTAPGFFPHTADLSRVTTGSVAVTLQRETVIAFRVRFEGPAPPWWGEAWSGTPPRGTSAWQSARGNLRFHRNEPEAVVERVVTEGAITAFVYAPGYALQTATAAVRAAERTEMPEFVLRRAPDIEGRIVRGESGERVPGARVTVRPDDIDSFDALTVLALEDGTFSTSSFARGGAILTAIRYDGDTALVGAARWSPGDVAPLEIRVAPTRWISGVVTGTRTPQDLQIVVEPAGGEAPLWFATPDAAGRFEARCPTAAARVVVRSKDALLAAQDVPPSVVHVTIPIESPR